MKEDVCSIPISDVFAPQDGCPICRMTRTVEEHLVDYITGAAMMEPDVREETNRYGFCPAHYAQMLTRRNRLSVALTLETHLKTMAELVDFGGKVPGKDALAALHDAACGCFVCRKTEWAVTRMLDTVAVLWQKEAEFRALYDAQTDFCPAHAEALLRAGQKAMNRKNYALFAAATARVLNKALLRVQADVSAYCKMYDYRNAGGDWRGTKNAIEHAVSFLSGGGPGVEADGGSTDC